ncbi:MAG: cytochrome P450 [Actinomycetota bacterium]
MSTPLSTSAPGIDFDDLLSDVAVNQPSRFYGALRQHAPMYFNPRWNGWIVTRYDDVTAGFRAHEQLSSDRMAGPWGEDYALQDPSLHAYLSKVLKSFVWRDPPFHTRMRTLLNKAFIPRSIERLRPRARRLVAELVEALPVDEPVDFLGGFAFHLPVMVICEYLGIPAEARDPVKRWSDQMSAVVFVHGHVEHRERQAEEGAQALFEYVRSVVRERRRQPQDDLISAILAAQDELAERFDEDEIVANIVLLVFAGHETTMNLISNGIAAFWRHPDQWRRLQDQPALVRHAVEEVLRVDGPLRATARWATRPLVLGGTEIKVNDRVLLVQIAANHDPSAFRDPDRFDIGRTGNRHVAFGHGIHTCLGAPLARMETQEAFSYVSERFDRVEVLEDPPIYRAAIASGGFQELHVAFRARR